MASQEARHNMKNVVDHLMNMAVEDVEQEELDEQEQQKVQYNDPKQGTSKISSNTLRTVEDRARCFDMAIMLWAHILVRLIQYQIFL
jgi:hypothetical protein